MKKRQNYDMLHKCSFLHSKSPCTLYISTLEQCTKNNLYMDAMQFYTKVKRCIVVYLLLQWASICNLRLRGMGKWVCFYDGLFHWSYFPYFCLGHRISEKELLHLNTDYKEIFFKNYKHLFMSVNFYACLLWDSAWNIVFCFQFCTQDFHINFY